MERIAEKREIGRRQVGVVGIRGKGGTFLSFHHFLLFFFIIIIFYLLKIEIK